MTYQELVDDINKDLKAIEHINQPLALYKDEQAQVAEIKKKQDESLKKVKKVVYPFWAIAFAVNAVFIISYYY